MRFSVGISLILLPALLLAQSADDSIKVLIQKLGSASFQERQAATKSLQNRPEAAPALREAARSGDREVSQRAAAILTYFDLRPVRELSAAVKDGRVQCVTEIVAGSPPGKLELESVNAISDLVAILSDLHEKKRGEKIEFFNLRAKAGSITITLPRIDNTTSAEMDRNYFIRTFDLDLAEWKPGSETKPPQNAFARRSIIVAGGSVRMANSMSPIIFANGNVVLDGAPKTSLIVSGGDVTLNCELDGSLVIARGKVTCTNWVSGTQIISGTSVTHTMEPYRCFITENEPNPLGFIRWTDPPKDKVTPKAK